MQNWDEYCALMFNAFRRQTAQYWFERAEALHLTFGLVQSPADLLRCPQLLARDAFVPLAMAGAAKPVLVPGLPYTISDA